MGFIDNIKSRDPIERLKKKEEKLRTKLKTEKKLEILKELVALAAEYEKAGSKTQALKIRIQAAETYYNKNQFKQAHPLYHQIAQVYMDHSKFERAAEFYKKEAMSALRAKAIKEYQLAIFLGCLSELVKGNIEGAERLHTSIREETGVSINLETIGEIVEIYCEASRREKFNKQRLQQALKLLEKIELRESEIKLAKKMAEIFDQQAATRVQLRFSFNQAWVGDSIQIKGSLESPMRIKIVKAELVTDLFDVETPPIKIGEFTIDATPLQEGNGVIGPLKLICRDSGGRLFPVESNILTFSIRDVSIDVQVRLQPTAFPRSTPTDLLLTVTNAGDAPVSDLVFKFSFSPEIEVTLGSTTKQVRDLNPKEMLEFPITVTGKKTGEAQASVDYSFKDVKGNLHKKKGKVAITIEKKTREKK